MSLMTTQEIFEKSANHLLKQNAVSMTKTDYDSKLTCAYRGDNGLMCAVGCLIPNEEYLPELEGESASCVAAYTPSLRGANTAFLNELQIIHDKTDTSEWRARLLQLGRGYKLKTEFLEE